MINKKWLIALFFLYFLIGGFLLYTTAASISLPDTDMTAVNRIVRSAEEAWEDGSFSMPSDSLYEYAVLNQDGALRYQSHDGLPVTAHDTVKAHGSVMAIVKDGRILGNVLIFTGYNKEFDQARQHMITAAMVFLLVTFLFFAGALGYLDHAVLKPFSKLKGFARHIAMGNLDVPLPMDKKHSFGAFTESFDLMRDQIREARTKEAEANRSKKELTASLSHDIKTPVTSIKLVSELLLAMDQEERTKDKLQTIYQKAEQIDLLVSNLLQASLEDLGELTVRLEDESSLILEEIIRDADCYGRIDSPPVPGCVLVTDRQRLCQVIDNILYNSYKYAGTPITIRYDLTDTGLLIHFQDMGKGVPEEELPFLFQKYYRGSNSASSQADGSGLGLYIAKYLMEKMGGDIQCRNTPGGFSTELFLPLAQPGKSRSSTGRT